MKQESESKTNTSKSSTMIIDIYKNKYDLPNSETVSILCVHSDLFLDPLLSGKKIQKTPCHMATLHLW